MRCRLALLLALAGLCAPVCCLPHQYHLIPTALPWSRAQTYCREHHADLATVSDTEDVERLLNAARGSAGKAWIGLHDNPTSWRWSFSDSCYYGEKEADYRNWGFGQPDNFFGDEMCVRMRAGGAWESSRCFLRHPFICYDGRAASDGRFVLVAQELSWSDAQLYCRRTHTDLASVRNERENQEMRLLAKNRGVWIGLYRTREWSDQSGSTYRYWKQGQPDNVGGRQSCTAADLGQAGLWSDEQCSRELVFVCYEADDRPVLATSTTVTPDKISPPDEDSATGHSSTDVTPSGQSLTPCVDQTGSITSESNSVIRTSGAAVTSLTPDETTTAEVRSTTAPVGTDSTASEQPSTSRVGVTRSVTGESPSRSAPSTSESTSTEGESSTVHVGSGTAPSTVASPFETPDQSASPSTAVEGDSVSAEVSSQPNSTPQVDPTRSIPENGINLWVKLTSNRRLSQGDMEELSAQFYYLLIEIGLPTSIKVALKTIEKRNPLEMEG